MQQPPTPTPNQQYGINNAYQGPPPGYGPNSQPQYPGPYPVYNNQYGGDPHPNFCPGPPKPPVYSAPPLNPIQQQSTPVTPQQQTTPGTPGTSQPQ